MKKNLPKSKELFLKICENEYTRLRKDDHLIFENINLAFDWNKEYDNFKKSKYYSRVLNENSDYEKMKLIGDYFYNEKIFPIVEGMYLKAKDLPITSEILLENTYLELNEKVKKKVNKKRLEFFENLFLSLDENSQIKLIEEFGYDDFKNGVSNAWEATKSGASATYRFAKKVAMDLALVFEAFTYIFKTIIYLPSHIPLLDDFFNSFITLDEKFKPTIKKELATLNVERPELKDFFDNELNTDLKDMLKDCWVKNLKTIDVNSNTFLTSHPEFYKFAAFIKKFFYKHMLRPFDIDVDINKGNLLEEIKKDNQFNSTISRYRLCVFDNIIDYLQSYAQVALEIGVVENRLMKNLGNVKNQRNSEQLLKSYKDFFNLNPKNKAEKIFITTVSNLVYLKEMFFRIKNDINDIAFYDRYIKRDIEILIKKVDQTIQNIMDVQRSAQRPPQRKYEESLRDNKEKKLIGNEPTENKKISVFDI